MQEDVLTPVSRFFVRNHFPIPEPPTNLAISGAVANNLTVTIQDLRRLPRRAVIATLECAGNGRAHLKPPVPGEAWGLGAVSTAEWSGVSLSALLAMAGLEREVVEILFTGADGFARSLPVQTARHQDTLVVDTINGEPLSLEHGSPLRLLVPGWYGMASVKWLTRIEAIQVPFLGHFQAARYVIGDRPIRTMQPRSLIVEPEHRATVPPSQQVVRGLAWTGSGRVVSVEISDDGGQTWADARLLGDPQAYAWSWWEYLWQPKASGPAALLARAKDSFGLTQPVQQIWNPLGYANNAAVPREVFVTAG